MGGSFFEVRGDAAEIFDPFEEAVDLVALLVSDFGVAVTMYAVDFVGNVRRRALGFGLAPDPIRVETLFGQKNFAIVLIDGNKDQASRRLLPRQSFRVDVFFPQ